MSCNSKYSSKIYEVEGNVHKKETFWASLTCIQTESKCGLQYFIYDQSLMRLETNDKIEIDIRKYKSHVKPQLNNNLAIFFTSASSIL